MNKIKAMIDIIPYTRHTTNKTVWNATDRFN